MGRTLPYLYFAVALVLLALVPGAARAQEAADADAKTIVVVIDSGNTDLLVESLVRSTAEAELTKRGFAIVENAEVGGDIPQRLLACAGNPECSVATLAGINSRLVIFISLRPDEEGKSNNFKIVARNYEVATGAALARTMRRCTECKEEVDLANFAEGVIADLVREPTEPVAKPPATNPARDPDPNAEQAESDPDPHVDTTLTLQGRDDEGSVLMTGLKYGTLGAGLLGLGAGTFLVLIDGPVIRDGVRQSEQRDTLAGGYASLAAGAVLVGVSAWLWSSDDDDAGASRTSLVPGLSPDNAGGSLVLMGSF